MKLTKAQREIIEALENGEEVHNIQQRMRAIQPLLDAEILWIEYHYENGIYHGGTLKLNY